MVARGALARARAVAEALFATEHGPPPADRLDWIEDEVEDFLSRSGIRARLLFSALLWICSCLAPLFVGKPRPLTSLPLDERIRALDALERRFGAPLVAIKAILSLIYYEHPDAARAVGFDGRCLLPARGP